MAEKKNGQKELVLIHRNNEIDEILGHVPNWIISWGISIILFLILILLFGTYLIKYPEIITSDITITTENPPASLIAKTDGKIGEIYVKDLSQVKKNQPLALIENTADYKDIRLLSSRLKMYGLYISDPKEYPIEHINGELDLGEVRLSYSNFLKALNDYDYYINKTDPLVKVNFIKSKLKKYDYFVTQLENQLKRAKKNYININSNYTRDSLLLSSKSISREIFEKSKEALLESQLKIEQISSELSRFQIQATDIEVLMFEEQNKQREDYNRLKSEAIRAFENLSNDLEKWTQTYVLTAPIDGKVNFTSFWSANQNLKAGDEAFAIVPNETRKTMGRINLPMRNSGKVKIGQSVNMKLESYPHLEYGVLRGTIKSISLIPSNNFYLVDVELPDSLKTNYGVKLPFSYQMQGTADIITEERRLLTRIYDPIRSLINK